MKNGKKVNVEKLLPIELLKVEIIDEDGDATIIYNEAYNIEDQKAIS